MANNTYIAATRPGQTYVVFAHTDGPTPMHNMGQLDLVDPTTGEVLYGTDYDRNTFARVARFVRKRGLVPATE